MKQKTDYHTVKLSGNIDLPITLDDNTREQVKSINVFCKSIDKYGCMFLTKSGKSLIVK